MEQQSKTIGSIYINGPKGEDLEDEINKMFAWMQKKKIRLSLNFKTDVKGAYEKYTAITNGFKNKPTDAHLVIMDPLQGSSPKPVQRAKPSNDEIPW